METIGDMPVLFLLVFRFVRLLFQWTSGRRHRERSVTNANSCVATKTQAPAADHLGPGILDHSPPPVVRLATSPCMSRQTLSSGGNANGSADSGPSCPSRSADAQVAPVPPQKSAD